MFMVYICYFKTEGSNLICNDPPPPKQKQKTKKQMILLLITAPKIKQNNHNKFSNNDWNDLFD